ncbi:hypothetical protein [Enterobacter sp. UNJFSC 003]|uniref:hypothetical protein n=1 Tax=Enterobacter sp. UNJFSC 003 TaxID=3122077 RepID=UPI002EAE2D05|nr:hypothetical protein [Serratia liquefaciens]
MTDIIISEFGAVPGALRASTAAIQEAINAAQPNDRVVIPAGRFLTGALFLKSGMTLHLAPGAALVGSQLLEDYPTIATRVAGIDMRWPAGVINLIRCQNVSITGTGTLDGQGHIWWQRFWGEDEQSGMVGDYAARGLRWVVDYDCQRPRNILVYQSENITLKDFTSRDITARRSDVKPFSRAFFIEGYPERPVCGLTLSSIFIDATEFGKISGVEGLRFQQVDVTAAEITRDNNDSYER